MNLFAGIGRGITAMADVMDIVKTAVDVSITALFPALIVGLLLAALIGYKRGIWRTTYSVLVLAIFYLTAFLTLDPLIKTLFNLDLTWTGYTFVVIKNSQSGNTFYAPITNLYETVKSVVEGVYLLYNVDATPATAVNFAFTITGALLKLVIIIVDVLLITLLGWLVSLLLWHIVFKRLIPKIAVRVTRYKWISMVLEMVKYVVVAFLFMTPTTSIVNSINQAYQQTKKQDALPQNEVIATIGGFLDSYNKSLFANAFFNWTYNEKTGLTWDAQFIKDVTTFTFNGNSVSIPGELTSVLSSAGTIINMLTFDSNNKFTGVDYEVALSTETVESLFAIIQRSGFISAALPLVTEVALNSDLLNQYFEARRIGSDKINWDEEIDNLELTIIDLIDSGVVELLIEKDADGKTQFKKVDGAEMIKNILRLDDEGHSSKIYDAAVNAIRNIDNSDLLSNAIPVALKALTTNGGQQVAEFLPSTWEELSDIAWGFEFSTLLDILHNLYTVDPVGAESLVDYMFAQNSGGSGSSESASPKMMASSEVPSQLLDFLIDNFNDFVEVLFGKSDSEGNPLGVDKYGRTIVYENGVKKSDVNYSLFDMKLTKKLLRPLLNMLAGNLNLDDSRKEFLENAIDKLTKGNDWMKKYKKEFNCIFNVIKAFTDSEECKQAIKDLINGKSIVGEGETFFDIADPLVEALSLALKRLDKSELVYGLFVPMLEEMVMNNSSSLTDIGLDMDYIKGGFDECFEKKIFGSELSKFLDKIKDIKDIVQGAMNKTDPTEAIKTIGDNYLKLVELLDVIAECKILNPSPVEGKFKKNGNYYNIICYLFSQINMDGFAFDPDDPYYDSIAWVNEYNSDGTIKRKPDGSFYGENGNFAYVIKAIADTSILTALQDLTSGTSERTQGEIFESIANDIESVFDSIDKSAIIRNTIAQMLDSAIGSVIGVDGSITFKNVTDWSLEGHYLAESLRGLTEILGEKTFDNLDFGKIKDIVTLNDTLHNLASSGIFVDKNEENPDKRYQFGRWIFDKIEGSIGSFSVGETQIKLLDDPENWDPAWGDKSSDPFYLDYAENHPDGTKFIAYRDFTSLSKEEWNSSSYVKMDTSSFVNSTYQHYYDNPAFITAFENGENRGVTSYELDELDRIACVIYNITDLFDLSGIDSLSADKFQSILNSINLSAPLRMCVYNLYVTAADMIPSDLFSLEPAFNEYLICGDATDMNPINSRADRQAEIDKLADLYKTYKDLSGEGSIFGSGFSMEKIQSEDIIKVENLFKNDLATSKVFNLKGSALDQHDGKYYPTVFQSALKMVLDKTFVTVLYRDSSPKDTNLKTNAYAKYNTSYAEDIDKNSKMDYIVDTCFSGISDKTIVEGKLNDLFECLFAAVGGTSDNTHITYDGLVDKNGVKTSDFSAIDFSGTYATTNINSINKLLKLMNNSEILYDCVPNAFDTALSSLNLDGMEDVNIGDASIYYHYNYDYVNDTNTLDYSRKYDEDEIDNLCAILEDALKLKKNDGTIISMSTKADLDLLLADGENAILRSLLNDIYNSYSMHKKNDYLDSLTHETVFEQLIHMMSTKSTLSSYAYNGGKTNTEEDQAAASVKLLANIKAISTYDKTNTLNPTGYYSTWTGSYSEQDNEIDGMIEFFKNALSIMDDGSFTLDGNMALKKLTPEKTRDLLGALNRYDICKDAVVHFIERGVGEVMGTYTKFNEVEYANFNLSQVVYGGTNKKGVVNDGSEIYYIYQLLRNMYDDDNSKYYDLNSDFKTITNNPAKRLDGVMNFLFNGTSFNNKEAVKGDMFVVDGYPISCRGVFMYNVFTKATDSLKRYIAGSTDAEIIATLSRIFTLSNATYLNESSGLCGALNVSDHFSDEDFGGDISQVKILKAFMLSAMGSTFDVYGDGSNQRSYFSSEIIGTILDTCMSKEFENIESKGYYYEKFYFTERANPVRTYLDVTNDAYDKLNKVEYDGVDGAISLLEYISNIETMKDHIDDVKLCFDKMGSEPGKNSLASLIYYISQAHDTLYSLTNNSTFIALGVNWTGIIDPTALPSGNSAYNSGFSFKGYGQSLSDWVASF